MSRTVDDAHTIPYDVVVPAPQRHQIGPLIASPHRHLVKRPRVAWRRRFHQNGSSRRSNQQAQRRLEPPSCSPDGPQDPGTDRDPARSHVLFEKNLTRIHIRHLVVEFRHPKLFRPGSPLLPPSRPNRTDQQPESNHQGRASATAPPTPTSPSGRDGRDLGAARALRNRQDGAGDSNTGTENTLQSTQSRWLEWSFTNKRPTTLTSPDRLLEDQPGAKHQHHKGTKCRRAMVSPSPIDRRSRRTAWNMASPKSSASPRSSLLQRTRLRRVRSILDLSGGN